METYVDISKITLNTKRLILREWKQTDLADFYEYASVKGVGEMAGWTAHKNREETQKILELFIQNKKNFALELKENHKVIGSLGLEKVSPCLSGLTQGKKGREIGYVLSKDYWGQGLMAEAVKAVMDYCFDELDYDFLCVAHFLDNHQSQRVAEKCGFRFIMEEPYPQNTEIQAKYYMMKKEDCFFKKAPIAVFDSGMGGISVLKELVALMPHENYLFFGDSKHAPYGKKTREEIQNLCLKWAEYFKQKGCKSIVIACNTATSASAELLRQVYPDIPIIGIEPALKPAVNYDYGKKEAKKIVVLATPVTLAGEKYLNLKAQYENQAEILSIEAPKIVEFVERGENDSDELKAYLHSLLDQITDIDGIVLGCTHFPFVKKAIDSVVKKPVVFFDGAKGCAKQTQRLLAEKNRLNDSEQKGQIVFENSDESGQHQTLSIQLFDMNTNI